MGRAVRGKNVRVWMVVSRVVEFCWAEAKVGWMVRGGVGLGGGGLGVG